MTVYLLQNQDGYFFGKSGGWLDGRELPPLYRTPHKDEALNQLFEVNSRNHDLRISLLECGTNPKKLPIIPDDQLPAPLPEPTANEDWVESETFNNQRCDNGEQSATL